MVEELQTNGTDISTENVISVPQYLDVCRQLNAPSTLDEDTKGNEWALFRDNDGRLLAQRMELVANEKYYIKHAEECIQKNAESKNPEFILVVATDFADESVGVETKSPKNYSSLSETLIDNDKSFVDGNFLCDKRYIHSFSDHSYAPEYFPCIRNEWYIQKPLSDGILVDDTMIVNTTILANDIRSFLKNNSISLENFAKLYMNRTQGTISDLLNHPKKWQELSRKGKDTYVKFMEFLSDVNLQSNINEMRSKSNLFDSSTRLPSFLMTQLEQGVEPNDEELSNAAAMFQLKYDTLRRYCHQQLSLQQNSKTASSSQTEEYVFERGKIICGKPGCGTVVQDKSALNLHLKRNCENRYHCSICENYFKTKATFDSHFEECHQPLMACTQSTLPEGFDDFEKDSLLVGDDIDLETQRFICCVCWCGFKSRQKLTKHLSAKHKISQKDLRPGVTCFVCFKLFKNLHALDVHMRTHSNARPFSCDMCIAAFQTKANLQRHIKTHTGEKPYACTYCTSRFIEKKALEIHSRTHTGEKPFQCTICNKCFVHKTPLKLHMLIHEGKKPHSCDKCGKKFRQKINLKVHMKRHSGDKKHKCPTCNLSFLTKTDWNRHNMMHTGEKPFQCQLCCKTFTRNCYLRDHLERLKMVTAPQCEICDKRFCNDPALKRHRKSHVLLPSSHTFHDHKVNPKEAIEPDSLQYPESSPANANMLLLSTKSTVGNDRQYFVAPIQSFEGSSEDIERLSLQSVMLAQNDDGYSIPITGMDGQPLFLQCVDMAGNSTSLFGSNGELLSSLKDIAIPITFSTSEDSTVGNVPVLEESDPNMHSTASRILDDSVILNGDIHDRDHTATGMELSEEQSSLIVTQTQQMHGNSVLVIPHGGKNNAISQTHIPVPVCVNDVILTETSAPEMSVQSCDDPSKNQTFVVVEP